MTQQGDNRRRGGDFPRRARPRSTELWQGTKRKERLGERRGEPPPLPSPPPLLHPSTPPLLLPGLLRLWTGSTLNACRIPVHKVRWFLRFCRNGYHSFCFGWVGDWLRGREKKMHCSFHTASESVLVRRMSGLTRDGTGRDGRTFLARAISQARTGTKETFIFSVRLTTSKQDW